ncbi:MAG TPA: GYD domain-containing protein [bacterium]|nr:GYD domain-containing protein [bacterium]
MPTYITLLRYTQKGAQEIKGGPGRLEEAKKRAKQRGAEIKAFYLTMGQYDGVLITEAPNDEAMAAGALGAGAMGYIRTETLRAFTEEEFKKLVQALP